jgi:hypothetical protein
MNYRNNVFFLTAIKSRYNIPKIFGKKTNSDGHPCVIFVTLFLLSISLFQAILVAF